MRITKTRAQAEAEKLAEQTAFSQVETCPECGTERKQTRKTDNGTITESMIRYTPLLLDSGEHIYKCVCLNCGCEWVTDEF